MKRRAFIAVVGGAAAWPLPVRAQSPAIPLVGFISGISSGSRTYLESTFRRGLAEEGRVESRNVTVEYHWAAGRYDRVSDLARELARRNPEVVIADSTPVLLAAMKVFDTTPIVFLIGSDPVKLRLVASLNRPGGNMTGLVLLNTEITAKRAELLLEAVPKITSIALLTNPENANIAIHARELQAFARAKGLESHIVKAGNERDLEAAFVKIAEVRAGALLVQGGPFLDAHRNRVIAFAARHAVPAMYQWREQAEAGGLLSYGVNIADAYRQVGIMAAQILNGRKPAELPVQQSTKIELIVNLKTAKALGLAIPDSILLRADEVIE